MIYNIYSSLPTFKALHFHEGLNILMAQKEAGSDNKQTRNRAGKSSLIEIIHFLTGANADKNSLFCSPALTDAVFGMTFDLGKKKATVERSMKDKAKVLTDSKTDAANRTMEQLSNKEWIKLLGDKLFGLGQFESEEGAPSFRSLWPYFARRQHNKAYNTPEKNCEEQKPGHYQLALLYLLGLDWRIAHDWQQVRDREKTLKELRKAAKEGAFGGLIGKSSDLRTRVTVAEAKLKEMQHQLKEFRVLPRYADTEAEANQLTRQINDLANANVIDVGVVRDLESAIHAEIPPPYNELEYIYAEAGISLPGTALKRYEEVRAFHESVIRNRSEYLSGELEAARQRIAARELEKKRLDEQRAVLMTRLMTHGALEHFAKLQEETNRKESEVEILRQRFASAEQLEGVKNELSIERDRLKLRLRRDFMERKTQLDEVILAFEDTSKRLYESTGSITIEETSNGPKFQFRIQGARSKGIQNMQIFCFDIMLMRLCIQRNEGPGVLIHDSHLFDGVDGRQVISALKVGAETAQELGFQYIVTINEDDAFKEKTEGFDLRHYLLPTVLTDAREDGGLFGFRFE